MTCRLPRGEGFSFSQGEQVPAPEIRTPVQGILNLPTLILEAGPAKRQYAGRAQGFMQFLKLLLVLLPSTRLSHREGDWFSPPNVLAP